MRQRRLRDHQRRTDVDREETVPDIGGQLRDAGMIALRVGADRAHADAGIVDDALEPAEMRNRCRDRLGAGRRLRQLRLDRQ